MIQTDQSKCWIPLLRGLEWFCDPEDQSSFSGIDADTLKEKISLLLINELVGPRKPGIFAAVGE